MLKLSLHNGPTALRGLHFYSTTWPFKLQQSPEHITQLCNQPVISNSRIGEITHHSSISTPILYVEIVYRNFWLRQSIRLCRTCYMQLLREYFDIKGQEGCSLISNVGPSHLTKYFTIHIALSVECRGVRL